MINFCTLFDSNYLDKVLALYHSLMTVKTDFKLYAQCMDDISADILNKMNLDRMVISYPEEFEDEILKKLKKERSKAEYCWTCTAASIEYFMKKYNLIECTYIDADLYFFENPECLFKEIHDAQADISIIEHRFSIETEETQRSGRYCVEFNYFNNSENAMKALKWWKESCFEWCYHKYEPAKDGKPERYGDQKYLEQFPVLFENVHILKHLGAGVAPWNLSQYKLADNSGDKILLRHLKKRQDTALVFYHFQNLKYISHRYVNINSQSKRKELKNAIYIPYLGVLEEKRSMLEKEYDFRLTIRKSYSSNKIKAFIQRYVMPYRIRDISDIVDLSKIKCGLRDELIQREGKEGSMKKKIVHIEDFFHPDAGYQLNLLAKYLAYEGYEVYVITSELDKMPACLTDFFGKDNILEKDWKYEKKYGVKIIRLPIYAYVSGRSIYTNKIWDVIENIDPDLLYVHGCDTYIGIRVLGNLNRFKCKVISDNHMVDLASSNKLRNLFRSFYKLCITPEIIKNRVPVLRMVDDDYVEKRLGIPLKQAPVINFGSDTKLFHMEQCVKEKYRKKMGIGKDSIVLCYAGKIDEAKGGKFLAEVIREKFDTDREIVFLIVGNTSGEYGKEVKKLFRESENRIIRMPTQKYEKLAKVYQVSDVAIFPFGCSLSFFDVQACGLPVISDAMNINIDRCSHGNGYNFEYGNVKDCREKISLFGNMSVEELEIMKKNSVNFICNNYDYKDIIREYINIFEDLLK